MINAATRSKLESPGVLQENHYDWLLNEFETFSRHKALEAAILQSADLLEKGEYGPVEDLVKQAVQIGLQKDLGTNYYENPRGRLAAIKDGNGQVSSGWAAFDKKLFGGFNRGELNIFAGGCVIANTEVEVIELFNIEDIIANGIPDSKRYT
jgi:hypothetical protein